VTDALKKNYERFMVTSMTLKRVWSFRYTTVLCVKVWRCGLRILVVTGKYNPAIKAEMAANSKLFICGHSHILKVMFDKKYDLLHMNPGACGKVVSSSSHHAALCD
jgi:predicted phosphodiesterase